MKPDAEVASKLLSALHQEGLGLQYPSGHPFAGAWQDAVYKLGYRRTLEPWRKLPFVELQHMNDNPDYRMGMEDARTDYNRYKERFED